MKVLVTGSSGFIGQFVLDALHDRGHEIHALGRRRPPRLPETAHFHEVNLLNAPALPGLLERIEAPLMLHMAWEVTHGEFWHSPLNLEWVGATLRLARAFRDVGGQRFVGAGTCAEYDWTAPMPCRERETPCAPHTLYGASKKAVQEVLSHYFRTTKSSFAWGRIFLAFGPNEHPRRLIAAVMQKLLQGKRVALSPGHQVRDFLYTEDMAKAFVDLLLSDVEGPVNIASGMPITLRSLAETTAKVMDRPTELLGFGDIPARADDRDELIADVKRLRDEVGFRSRFSLEEALEKTIAWWKQHP